MPLKQVFVSISDPRSGRDKCDNLAESRTVAFCAVLSGEAKIEWLRSFTKLEHGNTSHDTIGRVFGVIAPNEFESAFRHSVGIVCPYCQNSSHCRSRE